MKEARDLLALKIVLDWRKQTLHSNVQNSEEWLLKEVSEMDLVSSVETGEEL